MAVSATVHSDDYVFDVRFDAEQWFEQASGEEIAELARCGWGGDYPADYVALSLEDSTPVIADLMDYCRRQDRVGFECYVNADEALAWLAANRTQLFRLIEKEVAADE